VAFKYRKLSLAYLSWWHVRMASCAQPARSRTQYSVTHPPDNEQFQRSLSVLVAHILHTKERLNK
jgi:hypothetical protein